MKGFFEGWRRYLTEAEGKVWEGDALNQLEGVNFIDFGPEDSREIAQVLADKLGAELGQELGRGAMGVVFAIRGAAGEGRDMVLKVTQMPHENRGYILVRDKKQEITAVDPELADILPEVGEVQTYDYPLKIPRLAGEKVKIFGIPIEVLEPLPHRVRERLFGDTARGGKFKSSAAEQEWLKDVSDPKVLIPSLRQTYEGREYRGGGGIPHGPEKPYVYFKGGIQGGKQFEKDVLNLEPPINYQDFLLRYTENIKKLALKYADTRVTRYGGDPEEAQRLYIKNQSFRLNRILSAKIKIPKYPKEVLPFFGSPGEHPEEEAPEESRIPQVSDFTDKLNKLKDYGIRFFDTHQENVMMRPSTNDIVVADVGLFEPVSSPSPSQSTSEIASPQLRT